MCRINPLCDRIANAAGVDAQTVNRIALTLAYEIPREFWQRNKKSAVAA